MEDMPPDLYELYAEFGIAAEKAQVMELAAGNFALAYVMLFTDTNNITPEITAWFKHLIDDVNSKTFGSLLRTIKKSGDMDDSIITIIDEALEKRNYLTHHFFRSHNFAIHSPEGRRTMIEEIKAIQKKFDLAHTVLHGMDTCLHGIAGRTNFGMEEAKELEAKGKRVKI